MSVSTTDPDPDVVASGRAGAGAQAAIITEAATKAAHAVADARWNTGFLLAVGWPDGNQDKPPGMWRGPEEIVSSLAPAVVVLVVVRWWGSG